VLPALTGNALRWSREHRLDVGGQRLVASITAEAAQELGLQEGASVTAIVKASDVILATGDW